MLGKGVRVESWYVPGESELTQADLLGSAMRSRFWTWYKAIVASGIRITHFNNAGNRDVVVT